MVQKECYPRAEKISLYTPTTWIINNEVWEFAQTFFQPVLKLVGKDRIDGKTIRKYDRAKTPYRRVLNLEDLPFDLKARLSVQYMILNPVSLRASIDQKVALLWKMVPPGKLNE
ncbi:MAG: hypothetical protein K0B14_11485 [Anaerolineaceae bacterium]|nr:hypothetical protein [Anaerolineaceae bacterium]